MRKFAALSLAAALLAAAAPPLSAQSRARRVPVGGTAAPQPAPAPTTAPAAPRREPTIKSSSTGGGGQTQTAAAREPEPTGPVEVGEDEIISVNTTLVTMPVSVRDRDGKYIPNLVKEDFRVFEDNVEQQVAYFAATEQPFTVALVIDTSGSTRFRMTEIQNAAIAFVEQLRPDDRVMVITFDDQIRVLSQPTNDRRALQRAIRDTRAGNGTRLYDAVGLVINTHLRRVQGRKAVVLFTDGVDTSSKQDSYQSNMEDAEEADALIYPIQYDTYDDTSGGGGSGGGSWPGGGGGWPGGGGRRAPSRRGGGIGDILGTILGGGRGGVIIGGGGRGGGGGGGANCTGCTREEYERADRYLGELARLTGARRYRSESTRDLDSTFALVAEELRRQYSLGYYPARQPRAGERRRIRVRVLRPDLVVQARDSYVFGQPNGGAATAQQNGGQQQQRPRPTIQRQPFSRESDDAGRTQR